MAKTNNKGFSLIEIIIAVAILSILLTPIIHQFANSLETSRKAKALQEANETAVYEMEEFQSYSKEKLDEKYAADDPGNVTQHEVEVKLIDMQDDTADVDHPTKTIKYNVYKYKLPDCEIGAKKDKYNNFVTLDDLASKVRACGGEGSGKTNYKVAYDLTETTRAKYGDDFKLTNEGTVVRYNAEGFIDAVVCTSRNPGGSAVQYVEDANNTNLGYMKDLNKDTDALVLGGISSYDSEAYSALFSKAMDHLREVDPRSWKQALLNKDNESILTAQSDANTDRLIKIHMDKETKDDKDIYSVKVDVYYYYKYSLHPSSSNEEILDTNGNQFEDIITYTIFSQKFYTEKDSGRVPNIYFEYQPYCVSGQDANVIYKENDYILFDNKVDGCKLYLYKPYRDQMNASADETAYDTYNDAKKDGFVYYTDSNKRTRVKIHLASTSADNVPSYDKDGKLKASSPVPVRTYIYTNLDIGGYKEGATSYQMQYVKEDGSTAKKDIPSQFISDNFVGMFTFSGKSVNPVLNDITPRKPLANKYEEQKEDADGNISTVESERQVLNTLADDTRKAERLYTITVVMRPNNNTLNTVRLSGAKGAN